MATPPITDQQMDLLATRLASVGVGRRDFLLVAAGLAAMGAQGFNARPVSAAPKLAPGERLAREQTFRYGGGGWYQYEPASQDFNKDLYCNGAVTLFAGLMKFNADFQAVPYMAEKVTSNTDGSVWTFTIRKDSRWSDGGPVSARDFEWSWKRQLDPVTAAPYASFLYDIKNGEAFNKKQITDGNEVGVKAKNDWTLEVTLEGPRGYFPVLAAYLAALPAHRASVEKYGDKDVTLEKVIIPIIGVAAGALPYDNNELDLTSLQVADLKRLQGDPRTARQVFRYPFPGTWYLLPQVTKPPFDNLKVRKAVAHAIDRENIVKVSQGMSIPASAMIPPGFPGALDDPKIRGLQKFDPK